MENNTQIYKGVALTHGRTEQMIDTIIEKRAILSNTELCKLVGLESFRNLVPIYRMLNKIQRVETKVEIIKKPKKVKVIIETYKGVALTHGRTEQMIDTIIEKRSVITPIELAELVGLKSFRNLVPILGQLNKIQRVASKTNKPEVKNTNKKKVPTVSMAKNTYTNYYGKGKDKARDLIAQSIMSTKRQSSNILTLPADTWIMEKNIMKQKQGYKYTAVERDKETYKKMITNLIKDDNLFDSVIATANKTISEVIENDKPDTYSSAILDYCGFVDSFYNEINNVLTNNLVKKGGFITLTLAENDRVINHPLQMDNYSNTYIRNCYSDENVSGAKVTNDLINNLVFNNVGYRIVSKFNYKDTKVKMMLFIIERIN